MRITTLPRILASKVVPDTDLDLRPYGVVAEFSRVNEVRAARVYSPIDTTEWPTETLDWVDGEPSVIAENTVVSNETEAVVLTYQMGGVTQKLQVRQTLGVTTNGYADDQYITLKCDGVTVSTQTLKGSRDGGETKTSAPVWCTGEVTVTLRCKGYQRQYNTIELLSTGIAGGEKTYDLTGKWLALGIDMQGLAATVKIQGVEMPYSDYPKYFPLAPSELKIPGEWTPEQVRPVIEVYA